MKKITLKWLFIFIYLMISIPAGIFISAVITQIAIRVFYCLFSDVALDISTIDYIKILKGSVAGGSIGAIGCWWIYFKHHRKYR
ncbi:hypothetical protein PT300_08160 [Enterobacteriaceae bacterium ESL0689]|nr:hypothetical protein [Enterobacteriaceae bacterium ESL0689]